MKAIIKYCITEEKYYTLCCKNSENDFRASGSDRLFDNGEQHLNILTIHSTQGGLMMADRKRILLHGSYNGSNYGDILLAWMIQKTIYSEGADVVLNNASPYFKRVMGHDVAGGLKADLDGIDGAVFGGGGYIVTRRVGMRAVRLLLMTHLRPMMRLIKRNVPFMVCGVGCGPIHGALMQKIAAGTLRHARKIIVRNAESEEYLKEYGVSENVTVGADLALTFSKDLIPPEAVEEAEKDLAKTAGKKLVFIHINLLNPDGEPQNDIQRGCAALVEAIIDYARKNEDVFFIIGTDYVSPLVERINRVIYERLPKSRCLLLPKYDIWYLSAVLSKVDAVITTKLHVGIVSTALGKTVLSFSGDQKIRRFYRQIGAPERCVELNTLDYEKALCQLDKYLYAEPVNIEPQRKLAEDALQEVRNFIRSL